MCSVGGVTAAWPLPTRSQEHFPVGTTKNVSGHCQILPAWEKSCPVENQRTCHSVGFGTVNILFDALTLAKAEALRMCERSPVFFPSPDNQHRPSPPPSQRQNHLPLNEAFDCYQLLKAVSQGSASNIYGVYEMAPEREWFY